MDRRISKYNKMNLKFNLLILLLLINLNKSLKVPNPLNELFHNIFIENDYSTLVRPTVNATNRISRVETELKLLQIDLDEKYQELISTAWIEMTWFDSRLTWNPDDYDGITEITVDVDRIWVINYYYYRVFFLDFLELKMLIKFC
jgi:hypothetical protein